MKRELKIIEVLSKQSTYVSFEELADIFNVTTRTIRDDIKKIITFLDNTDLTIEQDKNLGVKLNGDINNKKILQLLMKNISDYTNYYVNSERDELLIQELFLNTKPIKMSALVELTKSSKTTVLKNIDEISKWLEKRNINIIHDQRGIYLEYDELNLRRTILEYISIYFENILVQVIYENNEKQELFVFDNILNSFLKEIAKYNYNNAADRFIKKFEALENTSFTDEAYLNAYFMICICLLRINNKKYLNGATDSASLVKKLTEYEKWINEYKKDFEKEIKTAIPEEEYFNILAFLSVQNITNTNAYNSKDVYLVREFIKLIESQLKISLLNDETLFESLIIHLSQMVNRVLFDINVLTPPVKDDVKYLYSDVYQACKSTEQFFEKNIGVVPSDDEIAYLTIHIAASIERNKLLVNKNDKVKVLIVCVSGIGTSNLLSSRVCNQFPNIVVKNVCSVKEFEKYNDDDIDLIISTTPLVEGNKKCICVSPLLSDKDISLIKKNLNISDEPSKKDKTIDIYELINIIATECTVNNQQKLYEKLSDFLNIEGFVENNKGKLLSELAIEEHVSLNVDAKDYKEAIRTSGNLLLRTKTISEKFISSMIASKELLGPNIVITDGLAFPHARPEDGAYKLGMSFITLKKPINFGNKEFDPVRLIISLSAVDKTKHLRALSELMQLVNYPSVLEKLTNSKNYEEFHNVLVNFENNYCKEK